jgi:hypothetical protein
MFANLLQLISRRPPPDYEDGFIASVKVVQPKVRNRLMERLLWIGWSLIAVKTVVVFWAVRHYHIPFSPWWVVAPTVVFAALVTWVYLRRS